MAITARAAGTWAEYTDDGTVAIPAGGQAGDRMLLLASWKVYTITAEVAGWNKIAEFADGTVGVGNGTGSMKVAAWYKNHTGSESDPTIDFSAALSGNSIGAAVIVIFQKAAGEVWLAPVSATGSVTASPFTVTAGTNPGITAGDLLLALVGIRDDSATFTRATTALTATGISAWTSNYVEYPATHLTTTTSGDMAADAGYRIAQTGTASAAPVTTGTLSATETGSVLFIRQRVAAAAAKLATPTTLALTTATFAPVVLVPVSVLATPTTAGLTLTGFAPAVSATAHQTVTPTTLATTTSLFAPTVTASDHKTFIPTTASLSAAAFAPSVIASDHQLVTPSAANLTTETFAPTADVTTDSSVTVTPGAAEIALTALGPTVSITAHQTVTPAVAALTTAPLAPTVSASNHQSVVPSPASLSLTAYIPSVVATDPQTVTPETATLTTTGFAPTINAGTTIFTETGELALVTFAPNVLLTDNQLVTPAQATLALASFAPTVTGIANLTLTPDTLALVLSAFAPTVTTAVPLIVGGFPPVAISVSPVPTGGALGVPAARASPLNPE